MTKSFPQGSKAPKTTKRKGGNLLDSEDRLVDSFGSVGERGPGWPNRLDDDGKPARPHVEDGKLHTPHAIAFDAEGNVYLSEWFIGGRLVRLERQD